MNSAIGAIEREWIVGCARCGKSYYSSISQCEVCGNLLHNPIPEAAIPVKTTAPEYESRLMREAEKAGFFLRAVAYTMDQILVWLTLIIVYLIGLNAIEIGAYLVRISSDELRLILYPLITIFVIITYGVYYTFYHGYYGQTLGKMLMGLKVIRTSGEELSYSIAFKRWLGYSISALPFGFGFIMPILTQHRQALHDKIADTFVIRI